MTRTTSTTDAGIAKRKKYRRDLRCRQGLPVKDIKPIPMKVIKPIQPSSQLLDRIRQKEKEKAELTRQMKPFPKRQAVTSESVGPRRHKSPPRRPLPPPATSFLEARPGPLFPTRSSSLPPPPHLNPRRGSTPHPVRNTSFTASESGARLHQNFAV